MRGRRIDCPNCGDSIEVPAKPSSNGAAAKKWIPVVCRLCHTRMYAEPHQIGQSMRCPDCFVETEVKPAPPVVPPQKLKPQDGYDLDGAPPVGRTKLVTDEVDVACPACRVELTLSASLLGEQFACPNCDRYFTVSGKRNSQEAPDHDEDVYDLAPEVPSQRPASLPLELVEEPQRHRGVWEDQAPIAPPQKPFWSGVYGFAFRPDCRGRVALLGSLQATTVFLAYGAIRNALVPGGNLGAAPYWITALFFSILTITVLAFWVVNAAASVSAIVTDSANGADDVENWPSGPFIDWFGDGLGLMYAAICAAVTGAGACWAAARHLDWPAEVALVLGAAIGHLLTPIFALSVLESGFFLGLLSPAITASLIRAPAAWLKFLAGSLLFGAAAAASWLTVLPLAPGAWDYVVRAVAPFLGAVGLFVYARLLGRLGWVVMEDLAERKAEIETP